MTEDGRAAMARQILPTTHIDTSVKVLQYIAPHVAGDERRAGFGRGCGGDGSKRWLRWQR